MAMIKVINYSIGSGADYYLKTDKITGYKVEKESGRFVIYAITPTGDVQISCDEMTTTREVDQFLIRNRLLDTVINEIKDNND